MALASVQYTGNGVSTSFSVPFPYISQDHVVVYVNDVVQASGYIWLTPSVIQFTVAPASGAELLLLRNTPKTTRLVDFQDGSILNEAALDLSANQTMYIVQEAYDVALQTGEATTAAQAAQAAAEATVVLVENWSIAASGYAAAASVSAANADTNRANAEDAAALAQEWATKMDAVVAGTDWSAKYYAAQAAAAAASIGVSPTFTNLTVTGTATINGLVIGTNIQAFSSHLTAIAAMSPSNKQIGRAHV